MASLKRTLWPIAILAATVCAQVKTYSYKSRPDLKPVALTVTHSPKPEYKAAYYLTTPRGSGVSQPSPAIYTSAGELVWSGAGQFTEAANLQIQTLDGKEVLTFTEIPVSDGGGHGANRHALILDSTYSVVGNVTAQTPTGNDFHEFNIPTQTNSTAILSSYFPIQADLTPFGGVSNGWILDSGFQEVDVVSGKVLFSWKASDHVAITDTYSSLSGGTNQSNAWDYFHINSADKDSQGNYLINSRHYHSTYTVSGKNGSVLWSLGGKKSDFKLGEGVEFAWQHFPRWIIENSVLSLFDNESNGTNSPKPYARGLILDLDFKNKTAILRTEFKPPIANVTSTSQGSARIQADGNFLVGWGSNPWITEYSINGTLIYAAAVGGQLNLTNGPVQNYRAFKTFTWKGYPRTVPDIAVNGTNVYVSWNGATEVVKWEVLTGTSTNTLTVSKVAPKTGFETTIVLSGAPSFVQVRGYDGKERLLGTSVVHDADSKGIADGLVEAPPAL